MASRMERYYQNASLENSRTARNSNLYNEIYDNVKYSNVEGIAKIEKTDEIDISKIREFIQEHDNQKKQNEKIIKRIAVDVTSSTLENENRQFDLKKMIDTAKQERPKEEKERYIHNLKYATITEKLKELDDCDIRMEELTNDAMLRNLGDSELSLELLNSLKSDENTFIEELPIRKKEEKEEMDSSFYTKSMKFSKEDFEELDDINKSLKKNNVWIVFLVIIILIIVVIGGIFLFKNIL